MKAVTYIGDNKTTEFTFNFTYYENSNIVVSINGTETANYTIIGNKNDSSPDIPYAGGKIIFDTAPSANDTIIISRELNLSRIVDYQPTAKINPTTLNQDLNYTIEVLKDFKDELDTFKKISTPESVQDLITKIEIVSQQINAIGDVSQIRDNISTLNTRTNGITDYVVANQTPTENNNYTWYRKYKSGWVEQGGQFVGEKTYQFPIPMANTNYTVTTGCKTYTAQMGTAIILFNSETTTTFTLQGRVDGAGNNSVRGFWKIEGFAAA